MINKSITKQKKTFINVLYFSEQHLKILYVLSTCKAKSHLVAYRKKSLTMTMILQASLIYFLNALFSEKKNNFYVLA